MDLSLIATALSALGTARDIGRAAIGLRDFNALAGVVSQLNEQILKAQDTLFAHQSQLLALQEELSEAKEKLRRAEQVIQERGRYALFEISQGIFVYRLKLLGGSASGDHDPIHYLCQLCFDSGRKAVLLRYENSGWINHVCPSCKTGYLEKSVPYREPRYD